MRVLLCTDGLAGAHAATTWLERFVPSEPSSLCIAAIAQMPPPGFRSSSARSAMRELLLERSRRFAEAARSRLHDHWSLPVARLRWKRGTGLDWLYPPTFRNGYIQGRRVEFELYSTRALPLQNVQIRSQDGTVILTGPVASRAEKLLAERVSRSVDGVKRVVNNLSAPEGSAAR